MDFIDKTQLRRRLYFSLITLLVNGNGSVARRFSFLIYLQMISAVEGH